MSLIQIRQSGPPTGGVWPVVVSFPEFGSEYELGVSSPGDAAAEEHLGWYFEQHLRYPFLDHGRRDRAAAWVGEYGRLLFTMVFGGESYLDYRRVRDGGFDGCTVAVVGDSGFQGLHWETLQDPDGGAPLAVRVPFTRKVTAQPKKFDLPEPGGQVRVLAVTARPNGAGDVGYRTISQPLLHSVRTATVPVSVDFVRPGTWEALRARLRDSSQLYGTGYYQVVHFDVHGAFTDEATLAAMVTAGDLAPVKGGGFAGQAGFVFFETATDGVAQAVTAREVAEVLAEHRVPVVVLNACQSAMQVGSQSSLAQELVTAGVPVAIGMAYSVTVTAARKAMPVLYGSLGKGIDPVTAARAMRQVLRDDPSRSGYFNQDVDLADWMLPVVYSQRPVSLGVREMTPEEEVRYYAREANVGAGPEPEFGFHGRDLDIHRIERAMLLPTGSNQLLVHGMAGAGKSTLLAHLGWWWARTGLVENIFRYSWEDRAWTLEQIIRDIASTLLTPQARARFEAMPTAAQTAQVAGLLRAARHLLILDNAESITATPASIPHALTSAQQGDLAGFLRQLSGGRTLVVVGSRQAEAWLAPGTFGPHTYLLPGLDEEAASELVDAILTRYHADRWLTDPTQRAAIGRLTTLLGGYPLPLTVVMPVLASTPPVQVLADLQAGQVGADPSGMITTAIEYSNAKLDPAMQTSLLLLAPFTATLSPGPLATYQQHLAADPAAAALGDLNLVGAVAEAVRVGLATPHRQLAGMVQVQPVLPYFLRAKLRATPAVLRAAVQAHYQAYADVGGWVHGRLTAMEADQRHLGQTVADAEYANLTTAFEHALTTSQPIMSLVLCLDEFLDQAHQNTARRTLLDHALTYYTDPGNDPDRGREAATVHSLAGVLALQENRPQDARRHHEAELDLSLRFNDEHSAASTYHQLGIVAQDLRDFPAAQEYYRKALDLKLRFNNEHSAARTYHQLGMVAQELRDFPAAQEYYRKALDLSLRFNDEHSAARTYHQLGMVAQELRDFPAAQEYYRKALDLSLRFNDEHSAAGTYHQLGIVAQDLRDFPAAQAYYRKALDLKLRFNDEHSAAGTYHQLGIVAQDLRDFPAAQEYYRKALDLKLRFNNEHSAASTYHQLGMIAQDLRDFPAAQEYYRKALDLKLRFNDEHSAAGTYHQLGIVAQELRDFPAAQEYYRKALDLKLRFNNERSAASTYHQLGMVAQELRDFPAAQEYYRKALDLSLRFNDEHSAASTYHHLGIVLVDQSRQTTAVGCFAAAAIYWRRSVGVWPTETIAALRKARSAMSADQFNIALAGEVPAGEMLQKLLDELNSPDTTS